MSNGWDTYADRLQTALADRVPADALPGVVDDLRAIHHEFRHECAGYSEGLACCLDALTGVADTEPAKTHGG